MKWIRKIPNLKGLIILILIFPIKSHPEDNKMMTCHQVSPQRKPKLIKVSNKIIRYRLSPVKMTDNNQAQILHPGHKLHFSHHHLALQTREPAHGHHQSQRAKNQIIINRITINKTISANLITTTTTLRTNTKARNTTTGKRKTQCM